MDPARRHRPGPETFAAAAPSLLLIKPAGPDCNLDCDYCFYLDRDGRLPPGAHRMSDEVLDQTIASYLAVDLPVHSFCWQGGEPTLMGLDFFRRVTDLQQRHARPGTVIANSLQTNAVLIDDAFAAHLADYRFLVGCSIDGPAALHDRHRLGRGGLPTHDRVLRGLEALQRRGVAVNAMTLVSTANVDRGREVFAYLRSLGFGHLQFIPCVAFDRDGRTEPWTITPEAWGAFLIAVFEAWRAEGMHASVRNFDVLLQRLVDGVPGDCTMAEHCRQYLVVEYDGTLYPCDFHVDAAHRLGDVMSTDLAAAMASDAMLAFGRGKESMGEDCPACRHYDLCRGGCPARRDPEREDHREWLCAGILMFLDHARATVNDLAEAIIDDRRT